MARIFSTATPGGGPPTISPPDSLKLFPSLTNGTGLPHPTAAAPVESKLDPGSMYMIAIEAREVRSSRCRLSVLSLTFRVSQTQGARMTMANAVLERYVRPSSPITSLALITIISSQCRVNGQPPRDPRNSLAIE